MHTRIQLYISSIPLGSPSVLFCIPWLSGNAFPVRLLLSGTMLFDISSRSHICQCGSLRYCFQTETWPRTPLGSWFDHNLSMIPHINKIC